MRMFNSEMKIFNGALDGAEMLNFRVVLGENCGNIKVTGGPDRKGTTMTHLKSAALATAAIGLVATFGSPVTKAHAAVVCAGGSVDLACSTGDGDESKLFEIKATGVTTFFDSIGANNNIQDVQTVTDVPVDTSNGFGEVDPSTKGDIWMTSTFSPTSTSLLAWDGLFVRGQVINAPGSTYDGDLTATVTQVGGATTTFTWTGLPTHADFATLGFDEPAGSPGAAILSATFSLAGTGGIFASMKQFQVSECLAASGCIGGGGQPPAIPESSTWAMLMLGFAGLGYAAYRRGKARPVSLA